MGWRRKTVFTRRLSRYWREWSIHTIRSRFVNFASWSKSYPLTLQQEQVFTCSFYLYKTTTKSVGYCFYTPRLAFGNPPLSRGDFVPVTRHRVTGKTTPSLLISRLGTLPQTLSPFCVYFYQFCVHLYQLCIYFATIV